MSGGMVALFFHHACPRDRTQVMMLGGKHLYPNFIHLAKPPGFDDPWLTSKAKTFILPILQMRKLRLRDGKPFMLFHLRELGVSLVYMSDT